MRILIAEDDPVLSDGLTRSLRLADFAVDCVHDGEQADSALALTFFGEFEYSIDLLLRHPALGVLWRNGKRRFGMRRFPYSLIYSFAGDEIRILAVAQHTPAGLLAQPEIGLSGAMPINSRSSAPLSPHL